MPDVYKRQEQYRRIIKPDSPIILFAQGIFSAHLMLSQPGIWRYNLVWQKDRVTVSYTHLAVYKRQDDYYRIPAIMQDCKTASSLSWQDGGSWNGYTFVRKATMPNIDGEITFKATISIARKPKYFLGIKIHRAIVQISWEPVSYTHLWYGHWVNRRISCICTGSNLGPE